jgi:eukaryotic-like serine/threonine-protein kinase
LSLKAVDCHTADLLAQEQVRASGKEQVLDALGSAATKLRGRLGESLASVQKYDAPQDSVTTLSESARISALVRKRREAKMLGSA